MNLKPLVSGSGRSDGHVQTLSLPPVSFLRVLFGSGGPLSLPGSAPAHFT